MKKTLTASILISSTLASSAALSIVANNTTNLTISSGAATWNTTTFPPSSNANVYWDANADGTFGNSAGENTGNTQATLNFTIDPITSGTAYFFGVEGFGGATSTGNVSFTITKTDSSTQSLSVSEGTPLDFTDSNGDMWQAAFEFNNGAYGNVVFNGGAGSGGAASDHQGVLTFTQIPEPSSTALLGLSGLALLARRRR